MTDWNRHHGLGETLLENWVEERAVGDLIIQDILTHSADLGGKIQSTHREAYSAIPHPDGAKSNLGKRRQFMEAELLKIAMSETAPQPSINTSKDWISTTQHDFSHTDVYPPLDRLGSKLPDREQLQKFASPITFWTDYASKGSGTAICSTQTSVLHSQGCKGMHHAHSSSHTTNCAECEDLDRSHGIGHRAGQAHQHDASSAPIVFGKHTAFSTPISEYKKGPNKE
eukprot:jgi/Hompol1/4598/HPOL_001796-RA